MKCIQWLRPAFLFIGAGLFSVVASAAQEVSVEDGKTYSIKVSTNELTRISVQQGRIEKAWANTQAWRLEPDKTSGELFLRGIALPRKTFSFFVKDSFGNTYTLIAQPYDIPSDTVELRPKTRKLPVGDATQSLAGQAYVNGIKSILKDMASGNTAALVCKDAGEDVPLWNEAKIKLVTHCENGFLLGDTYTLHNISKGDMVLSEKEFGNFGEDVRAVAIEQLQLKAGESTRIYIVRGMPQ